MGIVSIGTLMFAAMLGLPFVAYAGEPPGESKDAPVVRGGLVEATGYGALRAQGDEFLGFTCRVDGDLVTVLREGDVTWTNAGGRQPLAAKLPLPFDNARHGYVEKLWCGSVGPDLLLMHQSLYFGEDDDFSGGGLVRIARTSGRVLWSVALSGNVGPPLRQESYLYVTGMGAVGKLDLNSGKFRWRHTGLLRKPGIFVAFERPRLEGANVVFPAINAVPSDAPTRRWPKALVVNDATGKILEGADSP